MDIGKLPFSKFVVALLLANRDIPYILRKLKEFKYHAEESDISEIFSELRMVLPKSLKKEVEDKVLFSFQNEKHAQWLETLGVAELYDFLMRKDMKDIEQPQYFKWLRDVIWIHTHNDLQCLVNILLFNQEELKSISDIISFKYKKKIGIEALQLHMRLFWDCRFISAKEALFNCVPFRKNALILRSMRSGIEASLLHDDSHDGSDVSIVFHDTSYIKWKIGYNKDIKVPDAKYFLEKVKTDSYFKYYEAMNMIQSVEIEEESGSNDKIGSFDSTKVKKRNVEEQKARAAKHWLDLFVKADKAIPTEGPSEGDFFERMNQLKIDFDEEKIADIQENPDILNDIRGDM